MEKLNFIKIKYLKTHYLKKEILPNNHRKINLQNLLAKIKIFKPKNLGFKLTDQINYRTYKF